MRQTMLYSDEPFRPMVARFPESAIVEVVRANGVFLVKTGSGSALDRAAAPSAGRPWCGSFPRTFLAQAATGG